MPVFRTICIVLCVLVSLSAFPFSQQAPARPLSPRPDEQNGLCYIETNPATGWYAEDIVSDKDLDRAVSRYAEAHNGLIIPVFPTVYSPGQHYKDDVAYYNYVLKESGIETGDKVLVIGSGSGADTWVAWRKSTARVYAIDINPFAVANTTATAKIANFPVDAIEGDIRTLAFPERFSDFDYVLWNMPFLDDGGYAESNYHDHEKGDVLEKFLEVLPRLLKPGGQAILLNTREALDRIHFPRQKAIKTGRTSTTGSDVYVVVIHL